MNRLYEILEVCLKEIEEGADVESVLFHYPEFAEELRPILETSVKAKELAVSDPTVDVVRRSRVKLLQQAAQMREAKVTASRRLWSVPLRRALVTLVVIGALLVSSNGLVHAASTTVPGDRLYPVKRTWEDVLLLFTFNVNVRETLEVEHENERLDELKELFAEGRSVRVDFSGLVTRQNGDLWLVSGIPVVISAQTDLPSQSVETGDAVHVAGTTQKDGAVLAEKVELLPAGMPLPTINDDDSFELEQENSGDSNQAREDNSGKGSEGDAPKIEASQTPGPESESGSSSESKSETESKEMSVDGVVQSINNNIVVVNDQIMNISSAEIKGTPKAGVPVKVEGYYDPNGLFIVTKIEFQSSDSNSGSGSDDGGSDTSGGTDTSGGNDSPDSSSDGAHDDGGGGSSGSGGGGDG